MRLKKPKIDNITTSIPLNIGPDKKYRITRMILLIGKTSVAGNEGLIIKYTQPRNKNRQIRGIPMVWMISLAARFLISEESMEMD